MVAIGQQAHYIQCQIELGRGQHGHCVFPLSPFHLCSSSVAVVDVVFHQKLPDALQRLGQVLHAVSVGNAAVALAGSAKGIAGDDGNVLLLQSFVQNS